jgi:hypothetical protein
MLAVAKIPQHLGGYIIYKKITLKFIAIRITNTTKSQGLSNSKPQLITDTHIEQIECQYSLPVSCFSKEASRRLEQTNLMAE